MSEPILLMPPHEKGIIVGVWMTDENESDMHDSLVELKSLLATLKVETAGQILQKRSKLNPATLVGTGKVEEIKELADDNGAELVVFDRPLSPPQVRNIERLTGKQVMDRSGVILEIFARHARTNQAKTQVEIARLEYLLPRLTGAWTHFQRQTGGGHKARGMGEKQIEVDRRRARERIVRLQKQLQTFIKEKEVQRRARRKELKVAVVGYTNSGKTTIMHGMTRATTEGKNVLFATLDAAIRTLDPTTRPRILLSDTVGFIRNLPHGLIESFKSTLDEVLEADLLLHVVDISHENYEHQIKTTEAVLNEIGAQDIPCILVFNKTDQLDDRFLPKILEKVYPESIFLSAQKEEDMVRLREFVYQFFERKFVRTKLRIPISDQGTVSNIYKSSIIIEADYSQEDWVEFDLRMPPSRLLPLRQFMVDVSDHFQDQGEEQDDHKTKS